MSNRKDTIVIAKLSDDIAGATREVSTYIKPNVKGNRIEGEVVMDRTLPNGLKHTYVLPNLTRDDAKILVDALRQTFDLTTDA